MSNKKWTKIASMMLSLLTILLMVGSNFASVYARAGHTTNVHITKLKSEHFPNGAQKHDGTEKQLSDLNTILGTTVEGLPGVEFTYYKITDDAQFKAMLAAPASYDTKDEVDAVVTAGKAVAGVALAKTDAQGKVTVSNLEDGNYWFVETDKPETVSSMVAVPFGMSLPLTNPNGNELMSDVYVYPKNVDSNLPQPEKTVGHIDNKVTNNYDIGQDFPWFLKSTVPQNIKDYTKLEFVDVLDSKLTYVGNVEVTYGTDVVPASMYDVAYTPADRTFKVSFKTDTDGKLLYFKEFTQAQIKAKENDKLAVKFITKINKEAVMGQEIENGFDLVFRNRPDLNKDLKKTPDEKPKVVTGGKKFKKVDDKTALQGAEFVVKRVTDGTTTYLAQNAEGQATWVANKADAKKFTSDANGGFEVKGLAYSTSRVGDATKTYNYSLEETKAPDGYALLESEVVFTVDGNSYGDAESQIQLVQNKKLTIPQTGGIGTLIFGVVGITLMAGAIVVMKRRTNEE